ncbi:MAG: type II toxin-antitoxin system HipA family toxin YjjJ [Deltaproteobacteria bacterium]|nr:type II toxin-antitoxin system HipA family toxin YjjJ [Deltaproteobacteria bacterium]
MPKAKILDQPFLLETLLKFLSSRGPTKAKDLCAWLKISQPAFSRLVARGKDAILRMGHGPHTEYACRRIGGWGASRIPLFAIDEEGILRRVATIHPIAPQGIYLEAESENFRTKTYPNLPYFLEDLRPSGFLGRLVPRLYPDLGFPDDIARWTDDDCLVYLTHCGWNLVGNYILGEKAYDAYVKADITRLNVVEDPDRATCYPQIAALVLSQGLPGSSAAGEQPKFLAIRKTQDGCVPVLVKFSPPILDTLSQRVADLLICEHIAHSVLRRHGKTASQSCLIRGGERLFLEIERFDRARLGGRRGVISLHALDLEFVGQHRSWAETAEALWHQKKIDYEAYETIVWLDVFGKLIGNSDRHHGNIAFFCTGEIIGGLAPTYDMLPMMYAPQHHQLVEKSFDPAPPRFFERAVWDDAVAAARDYWIQVQAHAELSDLFRTVAANHAATLTKTLSFSLGTPQGSR